MIGWCFLAQASRKYSNNTQLPAGVERLRSGQWGTGHGQASHCTAFYMFVLSDSWKYSLWKIRLEMLYLKQLRRRE